LLSLAAPQPWDDSSDWHALQMPLSASLDSNSFPHFRQVVIALFYQMP
jgi:hypothetical protein